MWMSLNKAVSITWRKLFTSQVLKGDIRPAIETHEMLYQVTKKHNFLPEVIRQTGSIFEYYILSFNCNTKKMTRCHFTMASNDLIWLVSPTRTLWKRPSLNFMQHGCVVASTLRSNYIAWIVCADPFVLPHPSPGIHYWFQGTLGPTSLEAWVCREHLFPLQGNLSSSLTRCRSFLFARSVQISVSIISMQQFTLNDVNLLSCFWRLTSPGLIQFVWNTVSFLQ